MNGSSSHISLLLATLKFMKARHSQVLRTRATDGWDEEADRVFWGQRSFDPPRGNRWALRVLSATPEGTGSRAQGFTLTIWIPIESSSGLLLSLKVKRMVLAQSMAMLCK